MHIATEIPDGDRLLAKAPSTCCLKGVIANGEPRGSLTVLSDVETYVSPPDAAKTNGNIVIYFADIFGLSTNGRLIMDSFAGAGYLVLGLDYFRGVGHTPKARTGLAKTSRLTCSGHHHEAHGQGQQSRCGV